MGSVCVPVTSHTPCTLSWYAGRVQRQAQGPQQEHQSPPSSSEPATVLLLLWFVHSTSLLPLSQDFFLLSSSFLPSSFSSFLFPTPLLLPVSSFVPSLSSFPFFPLSSPSLPACRVVCVLHEHGLEGGEAPQEDGRGLSLPSPWHKGTWLNRSWGCPQLGWALVCGVDVNPFGMDWKIEGKVECWSVLLTAGTLHRCCGAFWGEILMPH